MANTEEETGEFICSPVLFGPADGSGWQCPVCKGDVTQGPQAQSSVEPSADNIPPSRSSSPDNATERTPLLPNPHSLYEE